MEPGSPVTQTDSLALRHQGLPISELSAICALMSTQALVTLILPWAPNLILCPLLQWRLFSLFGRSGPSAFLTLPLSSYLKWSGLCSLLGVHSLTPTGHFCSFPQQSSVFILPLSHCVANFSVAKAISTERLTPPDLKTLTFVLKNCFLSFGRYSHQSWSPTDLSLSVVFLSIQSRLLSLQT